VWSEDAALLRRGSGGSGRAKHLGGVVEGELCIGGLSPSELAAASACIRISSRPMASHYRAGRLASGKGLIYLSALSRRDGGPWAAP